MADFEISRNNSRPKMHQVYGSTSVKKSKKTPRRPVTPGKTKSSKAKNGRELWMNAIKKRQTLLHGNSFRAASPNRKTPTEFWVDTLRKTGVGLTAETNKNQSISGLGKGNERNFPYMSTSHYMRQVMGTERPRSGSETARPASGKPTYKSKEEYYDEVLSLRKHISALSIESNTNKTKIRRLEEDNAKKEKEMEALLSPSKNGELRRVIGDRNADSAALIHSLKQKILKLEMQTRDKEAAYVKLQADLKTTKTDEMRVQMEACYAEVLRLQLSKDTGVEKPSKTSGESTAKIKALQATVIRLSRTNEQLQTENKGLKDDLNRALENNETHVDATREYSDMTRNELMMAIAKLEKKVNSGYDADTMSLLSQENVRRPQGKVDLQGSVEDRLEQLDKRETELLDEVERLRARLKKVSDDKKRTEDALPPTPTPRKKHSRVEEIAGSRPQSGRRVSLLQDRSRPVSSGSRPLSSRSKDSRIENFKQKHAATTLQRQWRAHRKKDQEIEEEIERFKENRAAKRIQHQWLEHKQRGYNLEIDDAALTIQSVLKGHRTRQQRLNEWKADEMDSLTSDTDDGVFLIQSSLRGHRARTQQLRNWKNHYTDDDDDSVVSSSFGRRRQSPIGGRISPKPRLGARPSSSGRLSLSNVSRPGSRPSTGQRPGSSSRRESSHVFRAQYDVPGDDVDDDDDIMF